VKPVPTRRLRIGLVVLLGLASMLLPTATAHATPPAGHARAAITPHAIASNLYALANSDQSVWEYSGGAMNWWKIGNPANALYGGGYGLFAAGTSPGVGTQLWRYTGGPWDWQLVDTDATAHYAVANDSVYKQDENGVWQYYGIGTAWVKIGDPAGEIYAGGTTLIATDKTSGDVYQYNDDPGQWTRIGGPGQDFCINDNSIYALSPAGSPNEGVYEYTGTPGRWNKIGGPAGSLACGGNNVVATDPTSGNVSRYTGTPGRWNLIGGPGDYFLVSGDNVIYGVNLMAGVFEWSGSGTLWWKIGDPTLTVVTAS
jgi:hypothetical protein